MKYLKNFETYTEPETYTEGDYVLINTKLIKSDNNRV